MNRKIITGASLVVIAALLAGFLATSVAAAAKLLLGPAVWCLPYVLLVCGINRLARIRVRQRCR